MEQKEGNGEIDKIMISIRQKSKEESIARKRTHKTVNSDSKKELERVS